MANFVRALLVDKLLSFCVIYSEIGRPPTAVGYVHPPSVALQLPSAALSTAVGCLSAVRLSTPIMSWLPDAPSIFLVTSIEQHPVLCALGPTLGGLRPPCLIAPVPQPHVDGPSFTETELIYETEAVRVFPKLTICPSSGFRNGSEYWQLWHDYGSVTPPVYQVVLNFQFWGETVITALSSDEVAQHCKPLFLPARWGGACTVFNEDGALRMSNAYGEMRMTLLVDPETYPLQWDMDVAFRQVAPPRHTPHDAFDGAGCGRCRFQGLAPNRGRREGGRGGSGRAVLKNPICFLFRTALLRDSPQGPPAANHQPLTTNRQPPTANRQPPTANRRQPPTIVEFCFCGLACP